MLKSINCEILKAYFDLHFPGSFQSVSKFREALARKLGINVTQKTLRKVLKDNAYYQTNIKKLINYISSISCSKFLVALKHFVFNVATITKLRCVLRPLRYWKRSVYIKISSTLRIAILHVD